MNKSDDVLSYTYSLLGKYLKEMCSVNTSDDHDDELRGTPVPYEPYVITTGSWDDITPVDTNMPTGAPEDEKKAFRKFCSYEVPKPSAEPPPTPQDDYPRLEDWGPDACYLCAKPTQKRYIRSAASTDSFPACIRCANDIAGVVP